LGEAPVKRRGTCQKAYTIASTVKLVDKSPLSAYEQSWRGRNLALIKYYEFSNLARFRGRLGCHHRIRKAEAPQRSAPWRMLRLNAALPLCARISSAAKVRPGSGRSGTGMIPTRAPKHANP